IGVVVAQILAPHVRGTFMTAIFALLCLILAVRFALPQRFRRLAERPPGGAFRHLAAAGIGLSSGFAGIGGGILTNLHNAWSAPPVRIDETRRRAHSRSRRME